MSATRPSLMEAPRTGAIEKTATAETIPPGLGFESSCGLAVCVSRELVARYVQRGMRRLLMFFVRWGLLALRKLTAENLPPVVGAAAVVVENNRILMLERSDGLGLSLPGGLIKSNETAQEGLRREVQEETGYDILITGLLNVYSGPRRDPRFSSIEIAYIAELIGGGPQSSVEGKPVWLPLNGLPSRLAFDHSRVIGDYCGSRSWHDRSFSGGA